MKPAPVTLPPCGALRVEAEVATRIVGAGETASNTSSDILNALLALGYNDREAVTAMKNLPPDCSVSDGIRQALKLLSKGG